VGEIVRPRVLFIEGSAERRARVRDLLSRSGIELDEARDATEGMELAAAHAPDLVLLDDDVRDFDSGAAVRRLRVALQQGKVPLIVHGTPMERADCFSAGCDGFFDGPIETDSLPELLRQYLGGRRDSDAERLEREAARLTGENERLREQLHLRNDFLQNLAHELATPLTPISGYLRLMQGGRLGPLTERQQQAIVAMVHATERLGRSIDNLVDYSSLETGDYHIHAVEFDLAVLVGGVVTELHARARDKHLQVNVRKPEHLLLMADERRVRQAIANILDNAIKASPHGGHVLVEVLDGADRWSVSVYDQGSGLPNDMKHLHEGELPRRSESATGAGLGLPVSKQIVEAHGGALILESPPAAQPEVRDMFPGSRVA
jgi:signal transduction histidine kinase